MMSVIGAVYNTQSSGPKTDSWGTPQLKVRVVDLLPSIWTKGLEQPRQWHLWHLLLLIIISLIAYQAMFMYEYDLCTGIASPGQVQDRPFYSTKKIQFYFSKVMQTYESYVKVPTPV